VIVSVRVNNPVEAERLKQRVDFMRRTGILSEPKIGCPSTGCTCNTLADTLRCENWKRMDVV
jgi:hypothetical protein